MHYFRLKFDIGGHQRIIMYDKRNDNNFEIVRYITLVMLIAIYQLHLLRGYTFPNSVNVQKLVTATHIS